uniref:Uncharacterized protein n=1 Tax=Amphora coffeiformis TaxID=265554 RepID=A0A7S3L795_9STRA|mmetsp:Transcript_25574/g.48436  ORF Transcript_25574/g.48436 Transcript_25574/m.48436 type:complete len:139 (+) Transcript_25574:45-461(+)
MHFCNSDRYYIGTDTGTTCNSLLSAPFDVNVVLQEHIRFHHGVYLYMVTWQEKKNTAKPKEAELQTTSKSNLEYLFNLYDPKTILSLWRQYLITVYRDFSTVQDGPGSSNVNTDSYTVRANEFHPLMLPQCSKILHSL